MYDEYPNTCGAGDTNEFVAGELCCSCGGGSTAGLNTCEDTAGEALDSDGFGCNWYVNNPSDCDDYDDSDFISEQVCCACGGGYIEFDPMTTEVDNIDEILEQADNASQVITAVLANPEVLLNIFRSTSSDDDSEEIDEDGLVVDPATEEPWRYSDYE